ncbi:hypothetical protein D9757_004525 [Collybiopsis confluens]|uniref:RmlD-like substrate binding domain-containing protein n=1 Tax=Collybiopsis confluens TaxID=2823264 RepID=A0A8H5HWP3_9AGAR|nr:hypothetical protein D9757_004525 [Collybiopsis confluens]
MKTRQGLTPLNLINSEEVERVFNEFKPNWVIHCAAERRPDVAEKDPERTETLNVKIPGHLAKLAKSLKYTLVYISTDYVFDGTSPPYTPSAQTNPLQLYGRTKRDGEEAVLSVSGAKVVILRVPVLYGPAPSNADSAINILLDVVQDQSGKQYKMDHYATRYPTNVVDIAGFLKRLSEPFTKYEICLVFAGILGLAHGHIVPDAEPPKDATSRPRDCQLYTKETEDLARLAGLEPGGLGFECGFEEWWRGYLVGTV